MPLSDEVMGRYIEAFNGDPGWLFAVLIAAGLFVLCWKGFLPVYARKIDAGIELEKQREKRKIEESQAREKRDIERSKMEGRWIEQMERSVSLQAETNHINEAIRTEMQTLRLTNDALIEQIAGSREGSKTMLAKIDQISSYIKENKE